MLAGAALSPWEYTSGAVSGPYAFPMPEPLILGLDHVQLGAPRGCEAAARTFFTGVLGLPELAKPAVLQANGGAWFGLPDGRQLHVGVQEPFAPAEKAHPCLRCASLAAVVARLKSQHIAFEPDTRLPGRLYLRDPWGNRLEIMEGAHVSVPR